MQGCLLAGSPPRSAPAAWRAPATVHPPPTLWYERPRGGRMKKTALVAVASALALATAYAQAPKSVDPKNIVELELLTHTEVYDLIHNQHKTSVLVVAGGTEE